MRARQSAAWLESMLEPQAGDYADKYIPSAERFLNGEQYLQEWTPFRSSCGIQVPLGCL